MPCPKSMLLASFQSPNQPVGGPGQQARRVYEDSTLTIQTFLKHQQKIREMERILEEGGFEARSLTWEQLGFEVGLECSGRTIQKAVGTMDHHQCIGRRKRVIGGGSARRRAEYATVTEMSN